jgi:tetratricopeptide (TPR) repeat protein
MASPATTIDRHRRLAIALFIGLTVIAYLPTLRNGFVWDDDASLTQNRFVKSADGLRQFWLTTHTPDYWPVTSTTFWIEWRLWGASARGYHATNLSLHIAEALLLWATLRRLRLPGADVAALLFALHPVNVESVAWITQRKNLMAMLFYLASIYCFVRAEEPGSGGPPGETPEMRGPSGRPSLPFVEGKWYWLSLLAFTLAMLSKGSAAVLPIVLLGIIAWRRRPEARDAFRLAPYLLVAGVLAIVDIWFQRHNLAAGEIFRNAGGLERLLGAGAVVWFYLGKAVWPVDLSFVYPAWDIRAGNPLWWLPLLGVLGLTALLFWKARLRPSGCDAANLARREIWRAALFAWGYFCAALIPVMGFTDVYFMKYALVADHYQHLALIGVAALAGVGWEQGWRRSPRLAWAAAAIAAGLLVILTWRQCLVYRDSEILFETTLRENPASSLAHNNLGVIYADTGRIPEAEAQFAAALRDESGSSSVQLRPNLAVTHYDLGSVLLKTGRKTEAVAQFEEALRLDPRYPDAYNNLGVVLAALGRPADAVAHYEEALRLKPDFAQAHDNYGNALLQMGRLSEAADQYAQAVDIDPESSRAQANLGSALLQLGRFPEAASHLAAAVDLDPDLTEARAKLGDALMEIHRPEDAISQYEETLRRAPDTIQVQNNLGIALAATGRLQDAIGHYEEAIRLDPGLADAHYNLGNVLLRLGRASEAAGQYEQVLRIKPDDAGARARLERARQAAANGKTP